jgi:hypothetical protein
MNDPLSLQPSLHTSPRISQHTSPGAQVDVPAQPRTAPVQGCVGGSHEPVGPTPLDDDAELPPVAEHTESVTP